MALPSKPYDPKEQSCNKIRRIIYDGKFENEYTWQKTLDNTPADCFVSEDLSEDDYKEDPIWNRVFTKYQDGMLTFAVAFGGTDPVVKLRVSTVEFVNCRDLKKLCFVFHRNDIGKKLETLKRECWLNIRDSRGYIAARANLSGLDGYYIRGRIDLPDDLDEFRIEFVTSIDCSYAPSEYVPACVTSISDMWLEERDNIILKVQNLNDDSDPEPDPTPGPDPGPEPSYGYATAVMPETPADVSYTKIWFNHEGIAYRGEFTFADEILLSHEENANTIKQEFDKITPYLPEKSFTANQVVISDEDGLMNTAPIPGSDTDYVILTDIDSQIELEDIPDDETEIT